MQQEHTERPLPPWLIGGEVQETKMLIPRCELIQVGSLVAVNYAGYHLPPWCYFREEWPLINTRDKSVIPHEHVLLNGPGKEEGTYLSRSHEFLGCTGTDPRYEYALKKGPPHHVSSWYKFVSDDNEELLPPTMDETKFTSVKDSFKKLVLKHREEEGVEQLIGKLEQLSGLSEYGFRQLLDSSLHLLPSREVRELFKEIRGHRWEQEKVLMQEMHRRIDNILGKETCQFLSVQERRADHDKNLDRLCLHLVAQRMRFEVRLLEIGDIKRYFGIETVEGEVSLSDILDSMECKLEKDIEGAIEKDQQRLADRIKTEEIDSVKRKIKYLKECLTPKDGVAYLELKKELDPLYTACNKFKDEVDKVLELAEFQPGSQEIKWEHLKNIILAMEEEKRNLVIEESMKILVGIGIEEVQNFETNLNSVKKRMSDAERGVKEVEQIILKFEERLVIKEDKQENKQQQQQQQQQPSPAEKILSFQKEFPKSSLEVDDLNSYLRYPPIQNRLVLHEGYWPPLRNVGSEGTVSVKRIKPEGKEKYEDIKLSNLIGRFDEAFTLFSSTLADHGMPRPVPEPRPLRFRYGLGEVVPAWDHANKGISDMKLGEIRIMVCPSLTGYGERGVPESVPPFMPLLYVIRMDGIYTQEDDNYESDDDIPSDDIGCQEATPVVL